MKKIIPVVLIIILIGANLISLQEINKLNISIKNIEAGSKKQPTEIPPPTNNEICKETIQTSDSSPTSKFTDKDYNFEIDYPKEYDGKTIEVKSLDFSSEMDFISKQSDAKISDDVSYTFGNFTTTRHITDFGMINNIEDSNNQKSKLSLFAISIHPNKSNLSFEDFISQEIKNMPEGITNKKSFDINNISGYIVTLPSASYSTPESVIYYFPTTDKKTIFGIGTTLYPFKFGPPPGDPPFERIDGFIKLYPKYQDSVKSIEDLFMSEKKDDLYSKYPEFEKYEKDLAANYATSETSKKIELENIVKSFKF